MSDNIPFELQVEIIKKLPVKSLAISRSVSKLWKSTIDSPLFIANYTNKRQQHRLLIGYELDTFETKFVSIKDNDTLCQQPVRDVPVLFKQVKKLLLIGTSQGLLCLSGISVEGGCDKENAVIWNPSLGKSIAIDVPCHASVLGFGVRPDSFDPMIVMINCCQQPYSAMVFTLSSRVWRVPRGSLSPKSIYSTISSPVATDDRCIYWKAYERNINLVVAFDMVSEDFTEINLPHSVAHRSSDEDFSISKIKESLALLEYSVDADKQVCGVWMMVEDGVSKSFTKLFTINTPDTSLRTKVIGFRKNDQPIMETPIDEYGISSSIEVYEPRTRTITNLWINGELGSFYLSSYTESLLLLDQLDDQFVKISYDFDI
uniref:F-box protein At5g18160-like n=1 Tax=Erigeron canadensis TaxID=72917 RepID=UPI001CB98758|nr:F-box protein At5g18160-like [Erigeron canadensis]